MLLKRYSFQLVTSLFIALLALASMATAKAYALDNERKAELENLLIQDCGSCHGLTMKGGLGPALLPENVIERDSDFLADIILEGVPETPMPPWKFYLSREEVLWMVEKLKQGLN